MNLTPIEHKSLLKKIFDSDYPEQVVSESSPLNLFLTLRLNGIESCTDMLALCDSEQIRLILDLDLWSGDSLDEDKLWQWLDITVEDDGLGLLRRIVSSLDLKLVSLFIAKYTDIEIQEEPTDLPPHDGYYTPDRGRTWIYLKAPDSHKDFLLGRLLAVIFDFAADIFYQLIAIPNSTTPSELEEESYQDKSKRLLAFGVPDDAWAAELNTGLDPHSALKTYQSRDLPVRDRNKLLQPNLPTLSDKQSALNILFKALIENGFDSALVDEELKLIVNAAAIYARFDFTDVESFGLLIARTMGALNIGLETLLANSQNTAIQLYERLGLQIFYRVGLRELLELRKLANKVPTDVLRQITPNIQLFATVAGLRERFPVVPDFLPTQLGDQLETAYSYRAINSNKEIAELKTALESLLV